MVFMIRTENYCISRENLALHELIGLKARVVNSSDSGRIGLKGKIVDETKNTIVMETGKGEKTLPKKEVFLEVQLQQEKIFLDCSKIVLRPEERTKKLWRRRHGAG